MLEKSPAVVMMTKIHQRGGLQLWGLASSQTLGSTLSHMPVYKAEDQGSSGILRDSSTRLRLMRHPVSRTEQRNRYRILGLSEYEYEYAINYTLAFLPDTGAWPLDSPEGFITPMLQMKDLSLAPGQGEADLVWEAKAHLGGSHSFCKSLTPWAVWMPRIKKMEQKAEAEAEVVVVVVADAVSVVVAVSVAMIVTEAVAKAVVEAVSVAMVMAEAVAEQYSVCLDLSNKRLGPWFNSTALA
ncbi:hypothetical protein STEG23_036308 [Scotinomys teguina]